MMHAEELCHGKDNACIPWENAKSREHEIEKQRRKNEDGYFGIALSNTLSDD